jgi:hypothetical protein
MNAYMIDFTLYTCYHINNQSLFTQVFSAFGFSPFHDSLTPPCNTHTSQVLGLSFSFSPFDLCHWLQTSFYLVFQKLEDSTTKLSMYPVVE